MSMLTPSRLDLNRAKEKDKDKNKQALRGGVLADG